MKRWLHEWWITLRWGSPLTKAGRQLLRNRRDGIDAYVRAVPPTAALDCQVGGCRWGNHLGPDCDCAGQMMCHCGRPLRYGFDGDPTRHRGMCDHCDAVRCDAYPGACGR